MIIRNIEKNDKGEMEALVRITYEEVDYLKGCIGVVQSHKLMDHDDPDKQKLAENLKSKLLEIKGLMRP